MNLTTAITRRLGVALPIIQAPMAGGTTTPALVAAVAEAGGLGFLGAAYMAPAAIRDALAEVSKRTHQPFGINLFAPLPVPAAPDAGAALSMLAPYHAELGLAAPELPASPAESFDDQLAAVLAGGAAAFSFTFGALPADVVAAIKARGLHVMGTATTVEEAVALERAGVDAVIAQGAEAGAHRGTFEGEFESSMVGTMALVPQVVDAVSVPVVASGGIMDGRGIAAALALGAAAVQMGTAFVVCDESGAPEAHKERVLAAREDETRLTRAFSGRPARGIFNRFMREVEDDGAPGAILPYPWQNALTRPLRGAAARADRPEFLSLWAGQGTRLARRRPAGRLVAELARETEAVLRRLAALT